MLPALVIAVAVALILGLRLIANGKKLRETQHELTSVQECLSLVSFAETHLLPAVAFMKNGEPVILGGVVVESPRRATQLATTTWHACRHCLGRLLGFELMGNVTEEHALWVEERVLLLYRLGKTYLNQYASNLYYRTLLFNSAQREFYRALQLVESEMEARDNAQFSQRRLETANQAVSAELS